MRGVLDDDELEPLQQGHDTELTLGSGTLLALFFGLVLICGLCFGLGYSVGHRGVRSAAVAATTTPGEQEPLQASGTVPKPSAIAQSVVAPPPVPVSDGQTATSSGTAMAAAAQDTPQSATAPAQAVPSQSQQPQVRPAIAQGASVPEPQQPATAVRPAFAPVGTIMVQVAAVANPDDAEVLLNALRKRNYPVAARHDPADNLIHVRVGPFPTRGEADQWRMRLLNDGYNAIVQP
jgi:DedD protein